MKAVIEGVRIAGIRAVVPRERHSYVEEPGIFTPDEARKLHATIGVYERRVLPRPWCASDMCRAAAEGLLDQLGWDPASVDVLIFVSQDGDYVLPVTAAVLQRHLGLSSGAACFDVTLGCSGFVYGLWMAGRLLGGSVKRALVLCGDNSTRYLHPQDKATLPLFGDAGSATALELDETATPIRVALGTDGAGAKHIFVKAGGKRDNLIPTDPPRSEAEMQRLYRDARLQLNGAEVFAFTLRAVPGLLRDALADGGLTVDDLDFVVPHQANKMMLEHIRKKIGCPVMQEPEDRHAITRKLGAFKTSMLQDVEAGRAIELDSIVGAAQEIGRHFNLSTPNIDALLGLTRLFARTRGLYPESVAA